jgi:hypothetical protein
VLGRMPTRAAARDTELPASTKAASTSTSRAVRVLGRSPRRCRALMPVAWPRRSTHRGPRSACRRCNRASNISGAPFPRQRRPASVTHSVSRSRCYESRLNPPLAPERVQSARANQRCAISKAQASAIVADRKQALRERQLRHSLARPSGCPLGRRRSAVTVRLKARAIAIGEKICLDCPQDPIACEEPVATRSSVISMGPLAGRHDDNRTTAGSRTEVRSAHLVQQGAESVNQIG